MPAQEQYPEKEKLIGILRPVHMFLKCFFVGDVAIQVNNEKLMSTYPGPTRTARQLSASAPATISLALALPWLTSSVRGDPVSLRPCVLMDCGCPFAP